LATFLVEAHEPRSRAGTLSELEARAGAAAADLSSVGTAVRYVRSFFVPEDETCFHVFEATSADAVRAASERAGLAAQRIVEAVQTNEPAVNQKRRSRMQTAVRLGWSRSRNQR
jgi:Protein of unknown function (DUF4242)